MLTGFALVLLGAWGALIPFVGPYFNYAYTPNGTWIWTASRGLPARCCPARPCSWPAWCCW